MNDEEFEYPCIGICMEDPDSGYCQGCGRPPLPVILNEQEEIDKKPGDRLGHVPDSASLNGRKADEKPGV